MIHIAGFIQDESPTAGHLALNGDASRPIRESNASKRGKVQAVSTISGAVLRAPGS
jgi:hypothetical protein